jgi:hypothetical protein
VRIVELSIGMNTMLSNEQYSLLQKIQKEYDGCVLRKQLNDRDKVVAHQLVHMQVLTRILKQGKICYQLPDIYQSWRF